jgi:hypothetical protein
MNRVEPTGLRLEAPAILFTEQLGCRIAGRTVGLESALLVGGAAVGAGATACEGVAAGAGLGRGDAAIVLALAGGVDVATDDGVAIIEGAALSPASGIVPWPLQLASASSTHSQLRRSRWNEAIENS